MSLVLSVGLVLRARAVTKRAKVAATTTSSVAAGLLALCVLLAWAARDARVNLREGIVVVPHARLLDERHVAIDGVAPLAEGMRVRMLDEGGGFSHVTAGAHDGFLPSSAVLPIAKR
jgi:hypothetical protein